MTASGSKKKMPHVPFRDSVLTVLLKDCIGGNSKSFITIAVSPAGEFRLLL